MFTIDNLKNEINKLKTELIETSEDNDKLVAKKVVDKSQELDELIVTFMRQQAQN